MQIGYARVSRGDFQNLGPELSALSHVIGIFVLILLTAARPFPAIPELGTTLRASGLAASRSARRPFPGRYIMAGIVDDGTRYAEATFDFSGRNQRLVRISLMLEGQGRCDALSGQLHRKLGRPLMSDLSGEHASSIWRSSGGHSYVSFTSYADRESSVTCWKIYGVRQAQM